MLIYTLIVCDSYWKWAFDHYQISNSQKYFPINYKIPQKQDFSWNSSILLGFRETWSFANFYYLIVFCINMNELMIRNHTVEECNEIIWFINIKSHCNPQVHHPHKDRIQNIKAIHLKKWTYQIIKFSLLYRD